MPFFVEKIIIVVQNPNLKVSQLEYYSSSPSSVGLIDQSELLMYGYGFEVDSQSYGIGTYSISDLPTKAPDALGFYAYDLSGYFENGDSFSYYLTMKDNSQITFIPEPTSFLLLALGSLLIRKRKQ